jgi:hypothetical protein
VELPKKEKRGGNRKKCVKIMVKNFSNSMKAMNKVQEAL